MKTYYIVWNEQRNEGFITADANDAEFVSTGDDSGCQGHPTVGEAMRDAYAYDEETVLPLQMVELDMPE